MSSGTEREIESVEQHQTHLDVIHQDIDTLAKQTLELVNQLKSGQDELSRLVQEYQQERYNRQVEIWQSRCLTRCTLCYDVSPDHLQTQWDKRTPTPWGSWGLMPSDDAHYVGVKGVHTHRGDHYESDRTHTQLEFHRLCSPCYSATLKACAFRSGGLLEIDTEQVGEINAILTTEKEDHEAVQTLRERFGRFDAIYVNWYRLPILEQAYEIGQAISLDNDHGNLLRPTPLKT